MSFAPEQTEAALDGLGDGSSEPDGLGSALGPGESDGTGPVDSDGYGSLELEASGPSLALAVGASLPGPLADGPVVGVPSPQAESTSQVQLGKP